MRYRHISWIVAAAALAGAPAWAQPGGGKHPLADLSPKKALTRAEVARVQVWVGNAVTQLSAAETLSAMNKLADGSFLVETVTTQATPAFMDVYASACGGSLGSLLAAPSTELEVAIVAVRILGHLDHPAVSGGLVSGLGSGHRAIRYMCAQALRKLSSKLSGLGSDRDKTVGGILAALGVAGADPGNDDLVQQSIYGAMAALAPKGCSPAIGKAAADALQAVLAARASRLGAGAGNDVMDVPAFALAALHFKSTTGVTQGLLLKRLETFLVYFVEQYYSAQTAESTRKKLAPAISAAETNLKSMIAASPNGAVPSDSLSANLKDNEDKVRSILADYSKEVGRLQP